MQLNNTGFTLAHKPNQAQILLMRIGGSASLVAGEYEHYWADNQTPKKQRSRGRVGVGTYGKSLMAHFDQRRVEQKAIKAKS